MASISSPLDSQGSHSDGNGLHMETIQSLNPNVIQSLNEKRTTQDLHPPKRRGPKPDSKPALTRRQELNRQAQRTHRERKELYIKALEDEVLRLRDLFGQVTQERDAYREENAHLKALLKQDSISPGPTSGVSDNLGYYSARSHTGSHAPGSNTAYTPPTTSISSAPSVSASPQTKYGQQESQLTAPGPSGVSVDYENVGIDFVLHLEKPCMDHVPLIYARNQVNDGLMSGHAMMASLPEPFFAHSSDHDYDHTHIHQRDHLGIQQCGQLSMLLEASKRLDLGGEITPVMAWSMIQGHPRVSDLVQDGIEGLLEELKGKVRCYGFGAVMEEFELRDAISAVLSRKPDVAIAYSGIVL
jgi:hypothetical protein